MRQAGAGQIGTALGSHITNRDDTGFRGAKLQGAYRPAGSPGSIPLGNRVALNVQGGGPGKGRDVMRTGSQGTHGQPASGNPPPQRDFSDLGYRKN
jgi:hypothetical protein